MLSSDILPKRRDVARSNPCGELGWYINRVGDHENSVVMWTVIELSGIL